MRKMRIKEVQKEIRGVRVFIWASTNASDDDVDAMMEESKYFSQTTPYRVEDSARLVVRVYKASGLAGMRDHLEKVFRDAACSNIPPDQIMDFVVWARKQK